jgi:hypothetical protein
VRFTVVPVVTTVHVVPLVLVIIKPLSPVIVNFVPSVVIARDCLVDGDAIVALLQMGRLLDSLDIELNELEQMTVEQFLKWQEARKTNKQ